MNFTFEGRFYDTSEFQQFETKDHWIPYIWLTSDRRAVFYAMVDDKNSLEVRRASNGDIRRLAGRYKLDALRCAQKYPPRGRAAGDPAGSKSTSDVKPARSAAAGPFEAETCPPPFNFP